MRDYWRHCGYALLDKTPDGHLLVTDDFLRSLLERPPADTDELAQRLGVTPHAAARLRPLPGVQSSSTMTGA